MGRAETGPGGTRMTGVCNPVVRLQDPGTYSQLRKKLPGRRPGLGPGRSAGRTTLVVFALFTKVHELEPDSDFGFRSAVVPPVKSALSRIAGISPRLSK
jgi:hypothetical protein